MLRYLIIISIVLVFSCQSTIDKGHVDWQKQRFEELKDPYGWPSVIGLFHLRNTVAYFGRSDKNDFIIPNGPSSVGMLEKTDTAVIMRAYQSVRVRVDTGIVRTIPLRTDRDPEGPTLAYYKSLQWHIIERGDEYYLRVKDTMSAYRAALTEIPSFPYDKRNIVEANISSSTKPEKISYQNILGQSISNPVAAYLSFDWKGKEYTLAALDNTDDTYFVMVNDETTGTDTYGGGRYLYPKKADEAGKIILDFNKLINPPCVFTPFATCPLPPKSNHLPFKLRAGEKNLHLY